MNVESFVREVYIFGFSLLGLFLLSFVLYFILVKKGNIKTAMNYYTGKTEWRSFMEFARVLILLAATIYFYFKVSIFVGLFSNIVLLAVGYLFLRTLNKDENEELLVAIEYSDEEIEKWKASLPKKKLPKVKSVFCKKVVFTSRFIYLSKSKRIDVKNKAFKNFYIKNISFEDHFMILHYYYSQAAVFDHYFYVPKSKQQKLKKEYGSHYKFQF